MPCKVQSLLPSIGLELYQLGVQTWAKKKKGKKKPQDYQNCVLEIHCGEEIRLLIDEKQDDAVG